MYCSILLYAQLKCTPSCTGVYVCVHACMYDLPWMARLAQSHKFSDAKLALLST